MSDVTSAYPFIGTSVAGVQLRWVNSASTIRTRKDPRNFGRRSCITEIPEIGSVLIRSEVAKGAPGTSACGRWVGNVSGLIENLVFGSSF
jgi:hypothetical protein